MSKVSGERRAAEAAYPGEGDITHSLEPSHLISPEGVTDKELETHLASLREAQKGARHLLASGAGGASVAAYIASEAYVTSLGPVPEDEIPSPQGEPIAGHRGLLSGARPQPQEPQAVQTNRPGTARQPRSPAAAPPDRIPKRRRGQLASQSYEGPPGVQGANVGYWQAGGVTRAGAKRSKRP